MTNKNKAVAISPEVQEIIKKAKLKIYKRLYNKKTLKDIRDIDTHEDYPEHGGRKIIMED